MMPTTTACRPRRTSTTATPTATAMACWTATRSRIGSDPALVDSDGDGLWDADEVRAGTNPRLQDTDGDGLRDKEELDGWEIVYGFKQGVAQRSWVRSDPLQPDADGDTLMDSKEKVYGYNPNVPSNLNVLSLSSGLSESGGVSDGFVAPGQTVHYTATVKNELNNRWAQGLLQANAGCRADREQGHAARVRAAAAGDHLDGRRRWWWRRRPAGATR